MGAHLVVGPLGPKQCYDHVPLLRVEAHEACQILADGCLRYFASQDEYEEKWV